MLDNNQEILHLSSQQIENVQFVQLKGGSNVNYKLTFSDNRKLFFKYNPRSITASIYKDTLAREFTILDLFYKENQLTPEPILHDDQQNVLITEFVEGRKPRINDRDFSRTLGLIGNSINYFRNTPIEILQKLNTGTRLCPRNFFEKIIKPTVTKYNKNILLEGSSSLFQFLEDITAILTEKIKFEPKSDCIINWKMYLEDPFPLPHGLLHNDLALRNILVTNDPKRPICFIDWEYADFGDIAYDLAYLQSENQLLHEQIRIISSIGQLSQYIHERTTRYIKIFLPMLELINCYWTINHISKMISPEESGKKIRLRSPYSISENLQFINSKLKRLVRLSKINTHNSKQTELELLNEIQHALKIFERQLIVQ